MTNTMTAAGMAAKKPCNCGCGGQSECCEIECLVQPRFFSGQLLADQDLTALVDWTKSKTGLARFRHGWGIVCGLEIHCGPRGAVTVSAGYAMDCCGRDVVLCKDTTFDLGVCWKRPASPCSGDSSAAAAPQAGGAQDDLNFAGFPVPRAEVQVVDVFVRYAESQSDARTGLARGSSSAAACEYTRIHEGYELYCTSVDGCDDPGDRRANEWYDQYRADLIKKLSELGAMAEIQEPKAKLQRLIDYLQLFPPTTFCFLRDWLCYLQSLPALPNNWDRDVLFWIMQDWRNSRFRTPCQGCGPETGIRLGRVWLWKRQDSRGKEVFTTLLVNSNSPFRRLLAHDGWPAPVGSVNLAPYIWNRVDTTLRSLRQLGFTAIERISIPPARLPELLRQEVMIAPLPEGSDGGPLTIYYHPDSCEQSRIVCFGTRGAAGPIVNVKDLPFDHPSLDLRGVSGIGDRYSSLLQAKNIRNLVDLAKAQPAEVQAALASVKINAPDETRAAQLIELAKKQLEAVAKGA